MSTYLNSILRPDEKIIYTAQITLRALFLHIAVIVFCIFWVKVGATKFVIPLILLVPWTILLFLRIRGIELAFTDKRVLAKFGVISRGTFELQLDMLESVHISQPLLGRLLNFGSIVIVGLGGTRQVVAAVDSPEIFRDKIYEFIESLKENKED